MMLLPRAGIPVPGCWALLTRTVSCCRKLHFADPVNLNMRGVSSCSKWPVAPRSASYRSNLPGAVGQLRLARMTMALQRLLSIAISRFVARLSSRSSGSSPFLRAGSKRKHFLRVSRPMKSAHRAIHRRVLSLQESDKRGHISK